MKKLSLMVIIVMVLAGCAGTAQINHSTVVGTDQNGYATGHFTDTRTGNFCKVEFGAFGAGAGAAEGLGGLGFIVSPPATQADPTPFARSIAMINYSRSLGKLKIDYDGIVDYEFTEKPLTKRGYQPSFGPQPIK